MNIYAGFNFLSALRILNAPGDPILSNTGYWIQPEDLDDIRTNWPIVCFIFCILL